MPAPKAKSTAAPAATAVPAPAAAPVAAPAPAPAAAAPGEDFVALGRANLEAMVRAGTILGHGLQDIGRVMIGLAQDSVAQGVDATQRLMAARTVEEVVDLQSSLARSGLSRLLADGSRLSELSVKLAQDAFAPLGERLSATVDRLAGAA